ncbi:integral membrane ATP-dependent zinc metallopeptidase [Campylobacter sp. RM16704]|uniref:integral membrane ATP-dependent zinc metallopeptidase n=1 Tax=Campylobacter sp. RM16704 TaxID=1500960 RepID=UPI00057DFDB8|nr:integral membrane ATP-dependent zinc metallopeptidase [Campylobacter sp. RM16704]AJC86305.1 integral membrane ATP-dependent zinc metallopeptidase [Campylobacter sp. RM16704]
MKNKKIILASFLLLCILLIIGVIKNQPEYISKGVYDELLENNLIQKAIVDDNEVLLKSKEGKFLITKDVVDLNALWQKIPIEYTKNYNLSEIILILILLAFLVSFLLFLNKKNKDRQNLLSLEKNILEKNEHKNTVKAVVSDVKFKDVAGVDEAKVELLEIVDFLKNPQKYKNFGVKMPKGVLLVGPPGVGKTLIAKAVAGEAGVPFFYQSGASFVEIYVGMGAKRVRELFLKAKSQAPSIIFIDEIDAVGKSRGDFSNVERDNTLNQLLTQMDGFEDNSGVIVMAATNKIDLMDNALLRSGRFDRRIFISLPDFKDRMHILQNYMREKKSNVNLEKIAKVSVGFSGAALETLVNEAAINAIRRQSEFIEENDFFAVLNKVLMGKKKIFSLNDNERKIQATYQAAKALCAFYFDVKFEKITLVEDRFKEYENTIKSKSELLNKIKVFLAGSIAMELIFNENYTNAQSDFLKIKEILTFMENFGMASENLMQDQKQEVKGFLELMKNKVIKLANILLENEKLEKYDVEKVIME